MRTGPGPNAAVGALHGDQGSARGPYERSLHGFSRSECASGVRDHRDGGGDVVQSGMGDMADVRTEGTGADAPADDGQ
jgi:hypothetical protein